MYDTLSTEARKLMANITHNESEIDELVRVNGKDLDVYLCLEIKTKVAKAYLKAHGQADNVETAVQNLLYWCAGKAYGMGYENALRQYSDIIKQAIVEAAQERGFG